MKKNCFNCVELLVVVAVSGVLLTLLSGVADLAKDPKVAACADIMREIDKAVSAFEADHGNTLMSANNNNRLWGAQLTAGRYFKKFYDRNRMMPMGFECPAETRERKEGSNVYPHPVTGRAITYDYGLNWYTHGKITGNQSNIARSAVKNPAKLIRMTEGTKFALHVTPESATERLMIFAVWIWQFVYDSGKRKYLEVKWVKNAALAAMLILIFLLSGGGIEQFIYFQF